MPAALVADPQGLQPKLGAVMELMLKRGLKGLEAADEESSEALRRIKIGSMVLCDVRRPRNLPQHKKFRALLNTVWQACGQWDTVEELHDEIKFLTGWVDRRRVVDHSTGEVLGEIVKPKSTSFSEMEQADFDQYMESAIRVICEKIVPGIDDAALREEVLRHV